MSIAMQDVSNTDLGVENVSHLSVKALEQQLGFQDTLPPIFNPLCHSDGLNLWDLKDSQDQNGYLERLSLHWHQLCAVLAVIQKVFLASNGDAQACTGVLIADEVGLGKTAVGMALIALMANAVVSRQSAVQLPPCIGTSNLRHTPIPHVITFSYNTFCQRRRCPRCATSDHCTGHLDSTMVQ
jgi:TATA-binding protein-associated factor